MEGILSDVEKLLDVITVILLKLSEIENDIANDVMLILDKSKNEVLLIQKSILGKYKQIDSYSFKEDAYHEDFLKQDSNLTVKKIRNNSRKCQYL